MQIEHLVSVQRLIEQAIRRQLDADVGTSARRRLPPIPTAYSLGCEVRSGRIVAIRLESDLQRGALSEFQLDFQQELRSFIENSGLAAARSRVREQTVNAKPSKVFASAPSSMLIRPAPWSDGIKTGVTAVHAAELIGMNNTVIFVGPLGSGKTTMVRQACLTLLQHPDSKNLPLLVDLRHTNDAFTEGCREAEDKIGFLLNQIATSSNLPVETLNSAAEYAQREGQLIFVFDGLDELSDKEVDITTLLTAVTDDFSSRDGCVRLVATSRRPISGIACESNISQVSLCSFTAEEVRQVLKETFAGSGRDALVSHFAELVEETPDLASRPLFIRALIDFIDRKGDPKLLSKAALMGEIVDTLLEKWSSRRRGRRSVRTLTGFTQLELRGIVQRIALKALESWCAGSQNAATIPPLVVFDELIKDASFDARELNKYLTSEIGVICRSASGDKGFYFAHRSVGEYLAALELLKLSDSDLADKLIDAARRKADVAEPAVRFVADLLEQSGRTGSLMFLLGRLVDACDELAQAQRSEALSLAGVCIPLVRLIQARAKSPSERRILTAFRDAATRVLNMRPESLPTRIQLAKLVGNIGETRRGVGVDDNDLPDIRFVKVKRSYGMFGISPMQVQALQAGSAVGSGLSFARESPCSPIKIGAFEIAAYPVTVAQYLAFVRHPEGYLFGEYWDGLGTPHEGLAQCRNEHERRLSSENPSNPMTQVTWFEAVAFCRWMSKLTGSRIRLPSELEWERAARGPGDALYPWGDNFVAESCNWSGMRLADLTPVGSFSTYDEAGPVDMIGNVWEWTHTIARDPNANSATLVEDGFYSYERYPPPDVANRIEVGLRRVVRGGCYLNQQSQLRATFRASEPPETRYRRTGFRVCREAEGDRDAD